MATAIEVSAWFFASSLLLVSASAVDSKNNPADELVAVLNSNRTAHKSSALFDNPGLGCLALEYIKAYQGQCGEVESKKPPESLFADTFAPTCGVQAPTLSQITGRLLGCQGKYMPSSQAFSDMLIHDSKSLEILYDKNHTQVGAAVSGTDGGAPYFWCILFSNGKPNSTFLFEGGVAKTVRPGCFSGNDDDCSSAYRFQHGLWGLVAGILMILFYSFGL
ncbi:hypothetical protein Taro_054719 [Colocasia esculenta]|uniref:Ferredoxin-like protein n=1 Tax=Colocasia esculenta TaxID=4460 RepID=A0A843XS14_COLES|nr:hypothetical protein [Colocasia esculenta]